MINYNKLGIGLIALLLVLVFVGHLPSEDEMKVMAKEIAPVASPSPSGSATVITKVVTTTRPYEKKNYITVKVSHYWPDLGGVNCLTFKNGKCISKMANGETWQSAVGKNAIACPRELKFGTKIKILGEVYTCKDRGSAIVKTENDEYWVDMLQEEAIVPYGAKHAGEILK